MTDSHERSIEAGHWFEAALKAILLIAIGAYRTVGTSFLGGSCRFTPSCSAYALEAVSHHSPMCALKLIVRRILKCRPLGPYGVDLVPPAGPKRGCCA